jgi:hypothetical protein
MVFDDIGRTKDDHGELFNLDKQTMCRFSYYYVNPF